MIRFHFVWHWHALCFYLFGNGRNHCDDKKKGEKEMKKFKNIIAISAFSLMVLALPSLASAQWGGNNGGYNQGGRYNGNLENVADRLKDKAEDFERMVDRDRGNFGGNRGILGQIITGGRNGNRNYGNDNLRRLAEDFRRAANEFENRVDDNNRRDMNRGQDAANRLLSIGSQIDRELNRAGRNSGLQYQWTAIRNDLSIVANAYGRGNRGRGNGRFPF
jgi:hypothetical protein